MFSTVYKDLIVRYNKEPYHYRDLLSATHEAEGYNRICGDYVKIKADVQDGIFKGIAFTGDCCAVAKASASVMIRYLEGKPTKEFAPALAALDALLQKDAPLPKTNIEDLNIFQEIRAMPSRVSCASLPWHALEAALHGQAQTSTES